MKNLFLLAVMAIALLSACSNNNETKPDTSWLTDSSAAVTAPAEVATPKIVIPEKIGVSKMETKFTPFPKFDGGEGYELNFTIGLKLKTDSASREIPVHTVAFSPTKGGSDQDIDVLIAQKTYNAIYTANPEDVRVTILDNHVTKIATAEKWEGNKFTPAVILWQDPTFK
jgi:hypothetical protein